VAEADDVRPRDSERDEHQVGPENTAHADVLARTGDRETRAYVSVYSGPLPPSGGVSRPPFAVIAPH
jgi:hypothetical protein